MYPRLGVLPTHGPFVGLGIAAAAVGTRLQHVPDPEAVPVARPAPAVVGVLLLVIPRTPRAGSGFVLGVAVGLIVLSAVCVAPAGLG